MYAVGKLPDHVTRYNHKNESRWMTPPRPYRHTDAGTVVSNLVMGGALASLTAVAVIILQAV